MKLRTARVQTKKGDAVAKKVKAPKRKQPVEEEMKEEDELQVVELEESEEEEEEIEEPKKKQAKTEEEVKAKEGKKEFDEQERLQNAKEQARVALPTIRKYFENIGDKSLFPEIDQQLQLNVVYKKPNTKSVGARKVITLPCSSRNLNNTTICIIMPDLDQSEAARKDVDVSKQAREWQAKLEQDHAITNKHYSLLLTHRQLKREYSQYKEKRDLANAYDMFLCDARVFKSVKSFLGKEFHRAHRVPFILRYELPFVNQISKYLNSTEIPTGNFVHRLCVRFGDFRLNNADLVSNVDTILTALAKLAPGGWRNVRRIDVQPVGGKPSLPIYTDEGSANDVVIEASKTLKRRLEKRNAEVIDECNTLPDGLTLAIRKNGKTRVIKEDDKKRVLYPTIHDEWRSGETMKPKINPVKVEAKRKRRAIEKKKRAVAAKRRETDKTKEKLKKVAEKMKKKAAVSKAKKTA
ncbi:hypothetical protein WR25_00819 [Diploscapter pachys]|uniref:Ribosomal L1 domain-containing protein n=1 Tax=Diploscapter pachys TaxID=2018661 RepID=A0A2A2JUV0_9BILA|nr:hypothetical protein WR25_00819 [Diploscapter pachys]